MYTLKKNKVVEVTPPIIPQEHCHEEFVNQDFYGFVVVQTIEERDNIPLKLRQNGMIATIVEGGFIQYQLQTNEITGIADNNNWLRIGQGAQSYDGNNLFVFSTQDALDGYLNKVISREGQLVYSIPDNTYYKIDAQKNLVDAFPGKLTKPSERNSNDVLTYQVPVYYNGQPYWRTTDDFGKVSSVNKVRYDKDKNVTLHLDDILTTGEPKMQDTVDSVISSKRVLLYDPNTLKSYWKKLSEIGKINTVDNIAPIAGNIDLSNRYYTQSFISENFLKKPLEASNDENLKVIVYNSTTDKSYHIRLGDIPNLKVYTSPDKTIKIDDDKIYLNVSNTRYDITMEYKENILPLEIDFQQEYSEIVDVVINGKPLNREMYRMTSKNTLSILENTIDIFETIPTILYITIKGIKFLS